jgi:hypothetical protein
MSLDMKRFFTWFRALRPVGKFIVGLFAAAATAAATWSGQQAVPAVIEASRTRTQSRFMCRRIRAGRQCRSDS